jgi:hypothetical protein
MRAVLFKEVTRSSNFQKIREGGPKGSRTKRGICFAAADFWLTSDSSSRCLRPTRVPDGCSLPGGVEQPWVPTQPPNRGLKVRPTPRLDWYTQPHKQIAQTHHRLLICHPDPERSRRGRIRFPSFNLICHPDPERSRRGRTCFSFPYPNPVIPSEVARALYERRSRRTRNPASTLNPPSGSQPHRLHDQVAISAYIGSPRGLPSPV